MTPRAKRVPRLWCALQGLLPLDSCLAAQRAELAWPPEPHPVRLPATPSRNGIANLTNAAKVRRRGPLRDQNRNSAGEGEPRG